MGFFSELKEDLSQAVNELMPEAEMLEDAEQSDAAAQTAEESAKPGAAEESAKPQQPGAAEESAQPDAAEQTAQSGKLKEADLLSGDVSLEELLKNIDEIQVSDVGAPPEEAKAVEEAKVAEETNVVEEVKEEPAAETDAGEPSLEDMLEAFSESEEADANTAAEQMPAENDINEAAEQTPAENDLNGPADQSVSEETTVGEESDKQAVEQKAAEAIREESKGAEEKMENYENRQVADETATITQGMYIRGDIMSEGSVDVMGTVEGNIDILGKLNITGHIDGNSKAAEIYAEGAKINGEIVSEGAVKIGDSSVIIGNITAKSAAIAGAVKGDIDVQGPVILDSSAIVMGNIKSKSVQINNGAVIEGMCSQCYADVSPTTFFDDYKPETRSSKKASKSSEKNHA